MSPDELAKAQSIAWEEDRPASDVWARAREYRAWRSPVAGTWYIWTSAHPTYTDVIKSDALQKRLWPNPHPEDVTITDLRVTEYRPVRELLEGVEYIHYLDNNRDAWLARKQPDGRWARWPVVTNQVRGLQTEELDIDPAHLHRLVSATESQ